MRNQGTFVQQLCPHGLFLCDFKVDVGKPSLLFFCQAEIVCMYVLYCVFEGHSLSHLLLDRGQNRVLGQLGQLVNAGGY